MPTRPPQQPSALHEDIQELITNVAVLTAELSRLRNEWEQQRIADRERQKDFVTWPDFKPVRLIAYALAGSTLLAVLSAVLSSVIHK